MENRSYIGLVVFAFLLAIEPLRAQLIQFAGGDSAYRTKFEIAAIVYVNSIHEKMVYDAEGEFVRKNCYAPGFAMRFHRKHISFRTSFLGFSDTYNFDPANNLSSVGREPLFGQIIPFEVGSVTSVLKKTFETKLGIQVGIFEKRLSSYLFMDLGYRYVSEKHIYTYVQNPGPNQITMSAMEKANQRYAALHSGIGFRYQFNPWLSCAYECSMSGGISSKSSNRKERESSSTPLYNYVPALFLVSLYF